VEGLGTAYLKERPWNYRSRRGGTRQEYEEGALKQGYIAVNSALRDLIKGQVTAIECQMLTFEALFMPFMLTSDGRPLHERASELPLPQPEQQKVIALARP
jgi:hypothetical protein